MQGHVFFLLVLVRTVPCIPSTGCTKGEMRSPRAVGEKKKKNDEERRGQMPTKRTKMLGDSIRPPRFPLSLRCMQRNLFKEIAQTTNGCLENVRFRYTMSK